MLQKLSNPSYMALIAAVKMEKFKVEKLPETVFLIPNFVTEEDEELLVKKIYEAPKVKWTNLLNR